MDVAWQDSVGSFLDSSGTGLASTSGAFGVGDNGTLWSASPDTGAFADQSVLWNQTDLDGSDSTSTHLGAGITDSASGSDTSTLSLGSWGTDGTPALASGTLQGGLVWAGASSDTSNSLTNGTGVGLGALDLGAGSAATSQWQQFVNDFASQSGAWLTDAQPLLWTGTSSQPPITAPVPTSLGSQPVQLAPSGSLPIPTLGSVVPAQLTWTQPSAATGLAAGPSLTDAAPTPVMSGAGVIGSSSPSGVPIPGVGVGSHS